MQEGHLAPRDIKNTAAQLTNGAAMLYTIGKRSWSVAGPMQSNGNRLGRVQAVTSFYRWSHLETER